MRMSDLSSDVCSSDLTFYTPHVHNLTFLRTQAERIDMRLVDAWPRERREDRALFEKLKESYVKARYSRYYRISEEELLRLSAYVDALGQAVHAICLEERKSTRLNSSD